ncbi:MAG: lipid kinase, partial [Clostridiales bacterium]|nr:lipid kinase [Clostridiales bacterium]
MERTLLVYNPFSGNRNVPRRLDNIIQKFLARGILAIPYRMDKNSDDELKQLIVSDEFSSIVVSGGDGTVAGIVNTMLKSGVDKPVGIIPAGTCNDFARSLGIPTDMNKSIEVILEGRTESVDAGLINDELYFLNTCAGGNF